MRKPHMHRVSAQDECHFQFRAHADGYGNKVTIRVTESPRDNKLLVDIEDVEGDVLIRKECKHPKEGWVVVAGGMAWWCSGCGALNNDAFQEWTLPGDKT